MAPHHTLGIVTDRLHLDRITDDDYERHYDRLFSDPKVMRYLPGGITLDRMQAEATVARFLKHWTEHGWGLMDVCERTTGKLIGYCGVQQLPDRSDVELAYALSPDHWGRGFATEAAQAVVRWAFDDLCLPRLVALVVPENRASARVLEKVGMSRTGTGRYYDLDLEVYSLDQIAPAER